MKSKKHRTLSERKSKMISESQVRKIIFEELVRQHALQEGSWDDVKTGVKKLSSSITKQFKKVASSWAKFIADRVSKMGNKIPDEIKKLFQVFKDAMQSSGESFELNDTLKSAKEIGKLGSTGILDIVNRDLQGPVKEKIQAAQVTGESKEFADIFVTLSEKKYLSESILKEDFGATAALGVGLAFMSGLPMLFKGLHKLANALGAHETAKLFEKIEHVLHGFEQGAIDFSIPFRLAYAIYIGLWKIDIKLTKGSEPLNEIEIKAETQGKKALMKAKNLAFKILLVYFAYHGIFGALKAGASLLGFVEGTATTIKGVELASGAKEVMMLLRAAETAA